MNTRLKFALLFIFIAWIINIIIPAIFITITLQGRSGDVQMGYFIVGAWCLLSLLAFLPYIDLKNKRSPFSSYITLLFPILVYSFLLFWFFEVFIYPLLFNLIMCLIFVFIYRKKATKTNL